MRSWAALLVLVLAGCGAPQELPKQAEEVQSVAAEGALLGEDAAAGKTFTSFTRVHAEALRKRLGETWPAIENRRLRTLAGRTDRALERLAATPSDHKRAAAAALELNRMAAAAAKLGR